MPLVRIADLNQPDDAAQMIELAKQLSVIYDEYVLSEEDNSHGRLAGVHPSEFSACLRKITYSVLGYEKHVAIAKFWRQRFKVGHAIHDMVQRDFERLSQRTKRYAYQLAKQRNWVVEFEREVKIRPEYHVVAKELNLVGDCDGVFTFREDPVGPAVLRVALEIKSESKDEFEKLKGPRPEHVDQAHLYMAALDVPLTWFFYFSKGTQNNTKSEAPWLIPFNPAVWRDVEARCRLANGYADRKELGPRQEGIYCEFCNYAWHCQPAKLQGGVGKSSSSDLVKLRVPKTG
jgi:hypothetical protein